MAIKTTARYKYRQLIVVKFMKANKLECIAKKGDIDLKVMRKMN